MGAIILVVVLVGIASAIIPIITDPSNVRKKSAPERWGNKIGKFASGNWGGKEWGGDDKQT